MSVDWPKIIEQQKTPDQLNKETFEKISKEINELKDQDKNNDKIEGVDNKLTSGFFEHLKTAKIEDVKLLWEAAKDVNKIMPDGDDKDILKAIITFIEPIANPINLWEDEVNKMDSGWKTDKFYDGIEKSKTDSTAKITDLIANIDKVNNPDLAKLKSNLEKINKILSEENPKKEDVQSLQKFLENNLSGENLANFQASSFNKKWNLNAWDWKFWKWTMAALNTFIEDNTIKVDWYNKAKIIAEENDAKNTEAEKNQKAEKEQIKVTETKTDNEAKKWLDEAWLAGTLTTTEVAKLNDKTIKIDWDNVVYRWEKIPFADLGIARSKTNVNNIWGWMANEEMEENSTTENSNALILSYLDWEIPTNSGVIWINDKDSKSIIQALDAKKKEIDTRIDAKLKNSVVYNEDKNQYEYRWSVTSRDKIWNGESQISLQDFQNEVDKTLISDNNEERSLTTQVSADKQTTRKVIDFVWDNWKKIVIDKQNDDRSSTKTVDAQRWEREKVVTTEFDKEWNVVNKTKVKEDGDSFKEKASDKDWVLKDNADQWKEFVSANADDIISAIKDNDDFNVLSRNYDIQRDWDSGINIDIRKGYDWMGKWDFLKSLEWALKNKWIVNLDMKNYKFKWDKTLDKDIVTKLSFDVWEWTQKETLNKEFQKMDQIKSEWEWETIASWIQWFEYSKSNWQMFARENDEQGNYKYQKYDQKTNNRENSTDPYSKAGWDD